MNENIVHVQQKKSYGYNSVEPYFVSTAGECLVNLYVNHIENENNNKLHKGSSGQRKRAPHTQRKEIAIIWTKSIPQENVQQPIAQKSVKWIPWFGKQS